MFENNTDRRKALLAALQAFENTELAVAAVKLLGVLGYASEKTADFGTTADTLLNTIEQFQPELGRINRVLVNANAWQSCAFLFQLTDDEIPALASGQMQLSASGELERNQIESLVFLAIELKAHAWSRTEFTAITRELNRRFPMPVIVLFKHENLLSIAVIDRNVNRRDASRDVIDSRVTVIKDVCLNKPHRAHLEILLSLALENLGERRRPANFRELYDAWIATLSTQKLNQHFYRQLAWWYLWAVKEVEFPAGGGADRNAIGVIRLLTRLIFVWFIKERGLVPEALFDVNILKSILKQAPDAHPEASNYYQAILQNLFFATLNVEMGSERRWAKDGSGMKGDYLISLVYRYQSAFYDPDAVLAEYFATIPFLNGGLFECLDEALTDEDLVRRPELKDLVVKEGKGWVLRVDGFSRRAGAQAHVPNKLFFGGVADAELNTEFDTRNRSYPVRGLIELLSSYKFTVDENTPLDEEVALDPELLGKVFENLLASYNPDTRTTARKQSGSFYTPREVVDYMVDEALLAYFARHLNERENLDASLRRVLSHANTGHDLTEAEADKLVAAIEHLKVLDPACGSGAFPMGILNKLCMVLRKLDPDNRRWREQNLAPLQERLAIARKTPNLDQRDAEVTEAEAALKKYTKDFDDMAYADYTRKLFLIEKCIFGADIQPIAVQIAKLRFFIALIVSQPIDPSKPNWNVTPLPNLETKIVAANTLFSVPRQGAQLSLLDNPEISQKEAELREANAAYFTARTRATKKRRKERVQQLHEELVSLLKQGDLVEPRDAERMANWDPFDQNRYADFFDVEWMFGMPRAADGSEAVFDVVIGNPPYVRQEEIKAIKPLLKNTYHYECYTGTADLFVYFYERSVKLLKPHGTLSFITSNKWYRAKYGAGLRLFMVKETQLKQMIDFGDEAVFTAIAYPTIVVAVRRVQPLNPPPATEMVRVLNWSQAYAVEQFPAVFRAEAFEVPQAELKKDGWQLEPPRKRELLERIRKAGTPLGHYVKGKFYYGIKTGFNEAFVIDGVTRERLIREDPKSADVIKPFLRGRDVKRWRVESQDLWIIFTRRPFDISSYPAIEKHLSQWREKLEPKPDDWDDTKQGSWPGRKAGSYQWFEIQDNIAYWQEFEQPKIILGRFMDKPTYVFDELGYFTNDAVYIIAGADRYVVAILNSNVSWWFLKSTCTDLQNGYLQAYVRNQEPIPIPNASQNQKYCMVYIVKAIEAGAKCFLQYEKLLNGLVFELFFPDDLHNADIQLFDACEQANISQLADLTDDALITAATELAERIFADTHPIAMQLNRLKTLDIVQLIEEPQYM